MYLAGLHPVAIAAESVYLAVMSYAAKWLGQLPVRKCICAVTLMDYCKSGFQTLLGKIRVVCEQLPGHKHAFIADGSAGKRRHIKIPTIIAKFFFYQSFRSFAHKIEPPFQVFAFKTGAIYENLSDRRLSA